MATKAQFDALAAAINADLDVIGESATAQVNVAAHASAGEGTSGNPWTGWDTAVMWSDFTRYKFKRGVYAYATSPNFLKPGIELIGEAGVYLKHTGAGNAFVMDAGATPGTFWTMNVRVEDLIITGNSQTTNGLFLRGVRNGIFKHLGVHDVSEAGLYSEACVTNILENFRLTYHEPIQDNGFIVRSKRGIVTSGRGADWSTTWTIINPVIEGVSVDGIWFTNQSYGNTVIRGTSEANVGAAVGVRIDGNHHTLEGLDVEQNESGQDLVVTGSFNHFSNFFHAGSATISGHHNTVTAGHWNHLTIGGFNNVLLAPKVQGTFTDTGNNTIWLGLSNNVAAAKLGGITIPRQTALNTSDGIMLIDNSSFDLFQLQMQGPLAVPNPASPIPAQRITFRLFPSDVFPVTWGSQYRAVNGTTLPAMSGPVGTMTYVMAIYNASHNKWDCF